MSPDGRRLIFTETVAEDRRGRDAARVGRDPPRDAARAVPVRERNGVVSPDGRWLAYEANDSGRFEIFVRPFPDVNSGHWQVSTGGGTRPLWARNGQELFYVSPTGALMRVGVERGAVVGGHAADAAGQGRLRHGCRRSIAGRTYDIAPDGQRFLMIKDADSDQTAVPTSLIVVQHWGEELKRLVPTK